MKIYTIIGGLNGAGKSSLTGLLKTERDDLGVLIDVDKIAKINDISNLEAGKIALKKIKQAIESGINFTQETTLSGHKTLITIKSAKERGYYIRLYYICVNSLNELINRVKNRVTKGGHKIPEKTLKYRYDKYIGDICAILPYCDTAVFYDNENGFAEVGYFKNGEIIKTVGNVPKWLERIINTFNSNRN